MRTVFHRRCSTFRTKSSVGLRDTCKDYCPVIDPCGNSRCLDGNTDSVPDSIVSSDAWCFSPTKADARNIHGKFVEVTAIYIDILFEVSSYSAQRKGSRSSVACKPGTTFSWLEPSSAFSGADLPYPPLSQACIQF